MPGVRARGRAVKRSPFVPPGRERDYVAAVISTLLMVMIFRPLRAQVGRALDRRFSREQYEYTATIRKASSVLVSIINLGHRLYV